jgi:hypothetical protein
MYCCAKVFIAVVNTAILIGAGLAGWLLYLHYNDLPWTHFDGANLPAVFFLVVAIFAVVSAIIGLIAICVRKCCRVLYLVIVVIVILLETGAGVLAFLYHDKILNLIEENWDKPAFQESRLKVEEVLKCCGFESYNPDVVCGFAPVVNGTPSCEELLKEDIKKYGTELGVAGVVLAGVQLLLLCAAIFLVCDRPRESITKF